MAVNVFGGDGQLTEERVATWARLMAGVDVSVFGQSAWAPSAVAAQDRTVQVAAGTGFGFGVLIESPGVEYTQLAPVASGSRFDLVAWELNWTPGDGSVGISGRLVSIAGTSSQVRPSYTDRIGTGVAYVPIALVRVTAGQQVPVIVEDYRTWGSSVVRAVSLAAVRYPRVGQLVELTNGVRWMHTGSGWVKDFTETLSWTGITENITPGFQLNQQTTVLPAWRASTIHGANTLGVTGSGTKTIGLRAGVYRIEPFAHSTDNGALMWALYIGGSGFPSSVGNPSDNYGGRILGYCLNGASKTIILNADTTLTLILRATGGTVSLAGSSEYLDIFRVGDVA